MVIDKFEVLTDKKLEKNLKIVLISDIHVSHNAILRNDKNIKDTLNGALKIRDVDFFVLCGDFINDTHDWKNEKVIQTFEDFLKKFGEKAPVFVTRGNHDLIFHNKKNEEVFQEFGKLENVFIFEDAQKDFLGVNLTAFCPSKHSYDLRKHGETAQKLAVSDFLARKFKFDEKKFNLFITHSPYSMTNKYALKAIPEFFEKCDVILSGHLHNGLIFSRNFDSISKKINQFDDKKGVKGFLARNADFGFWVDPKTGFMASKCRGGKFVGDGKIGRSFLPCSKTYTKVDLTKEPGKTLQIISKGVNKYAAIPVFVGKPSVVELKITQKN